MDFFALCDEWFIAFSREKKPPALLIPEDVYHCLIQGNGLLKIGNLKRSLIQLDQAPHQKGIVIQVARVGSISMPIAAKQSSIGCPEILQDEAGGPFGCFRISLITKDLVSFCKGRDHKTVPGS